MMQTLYKHLFLHGFGCTHLQRLCKGWMTEENYFFLHFRRGRGTNECTRFLMQPFLLLSTFTSSKRKYDISDSLVFPGYMLTHCCGFQATEPSPFHSLHAPIPTSRRNIALPITFSWVSSLQPSEFVTRGLLA